MKTKIQIRRYLLGQKWYDRFVENVKKAGWNDAAMDQARVDYFIRGGLESIQ